MGPLQRLSMAGVCHRRRRPHTTKAREHTMSVHDGQANNPCGFVAGFTCPKANAAFPPSPSE